MDDGRMAYFGDWQGHFPPILEDAEEIPIPTEEPCGYCNEHFVEGDLGLQYLSGYTVHHECNLRSVIGSVGHIKGTCSCFGGDEGDPPGMSRREAAKAAVEALSENP